MERVSKYWRIACAALLIALPAGGADLPDYTHGVKAFPKFWQAYRMPQVPQPNLANGRRLLELIQDGKLNLSLASLNDLVEEDSLELVAARYNVDIAETDVLRAKSGQAARGAPGVPLPGEVFAGALGAGVGGASGAGGGGVGPAAISASARQVFVGPRGTFDPDVSVVVSYDHATSPLNTLQVAGINTVATPSADVLTRFEKTFSTGFSFSVSFNSQRQSSTQQFLRFDPAYTSRLSISMVQPLLNGFGFAVNRRFINISKNDVQIARQLFRQQVSTALVNAQNAYWDLVAARENVKAAQHALDTAQKLFEDTRQQEALGISAALDVMQARSAMAGSRRDLIVAQSAVKTRELALKALISKSLDTLGEIELTTADALPDPRDGDFPSIPEAVRTAQSNRSELIQADLNIRNQELTERYTRDALKPTFNVFTSYSSSALTYGVGPMMQQVWLSFPYPEYAAGFSLQIPLRNRSAQADNIRAQLELNQMRTTRVRTENQIGLDVHTAVVALVQSRAQVEAARSVVESSQATLDAERKRLEIGSSTPYRVIQVQRDLVAAQSQAIQARANYAKARVAFERACGTVLQQNGISVDDALRAR